MGKFLALTAAVLAFLLVPALASAAPTASHISTPATTAFVTFNKENPGTFHVAGTTIGDGLLDLRCYLGTGTPRLVASGITAKNGVFSVDVPVTQTLMQAIGAPHPFCMLRAVPAGTIPSAPPDLSSQWEGVFVGWGWRETETVGSGFSPTPPDAIRDFYISRAQSRAMNDFQSIAGCGLCDTYLFVPGSQTISNPIWFANSVLDGSLSEITDRTAVRIDGADAYSGQSAYANGQNHHLANNPGFPALSESDSVNQSDGDLTIHESAPYARCTEDPSVIPPTDASCSSFTDTGVGYERSIKTTDSGQRVTIVDHWKSTDGRPHMLDVIYADTTNTNGANAGHEGIANFTWTGDGFKSYPADTQVPLPASAPATMLLKIDNTTSNGGDNMNPMGAQVFGSRPDGLKLLGLGSISDSEGYWQTRYQRTIPAGGEITIANAYVHDFALAAVQGKAAQAEIAVTPPALHVDAPVDGSTVDAATVHVSGTVSSKDGGFSLSVNGNHVVADPSTGNWGTDVPLAEGDNRILVSAQNDIGVVANEIVHVTRPAAPAAESPVVPVVAPAVTPKLVRCVVPKLRGKTLRKAKRLLKKAHCRLGKVSRKLSKNVKPGRIVKTRFKVGSRHHVGARVRVTIAKKARRS